MWWGHDFGWGWMMAGGFTLLLVLGSLTFLGFLAIRAINLSSSRSETGADQTPPASRSKAMEILQERYARGEITKAEYEEIRADLQS